MQSKLQGARHMKWVSVPATVRVGDQVQEKKGQRRLQIFCPDPPTFCDFCPPYLPHPNAPELEESFFFFFLSAGS